jgi:hypothetical protein
MEGANLRYRLVVPTNRRTIVGDDAISETSAVGASMALRLACDSCLPSVPYQVVQ